MFWDKQNVEIDIKVPKARSDAPEAIATKI